MAVKLGLDAKLYRNTGTFASPAWNEIQNVKDVTLNLEAGKADVTTRGSAGRRSCSPAPTPSSGRGSCRWRSTC